MRNPELGIDYALVVAPIAIGMVDTSRSRSGWPVMATLGIIIKIK